MWFGSFARACLTKAMFANVSSISVGANGKFHILIIVVINCLSVRNSQIWKLDCKQSYCPCLTPSLTDIDCHENELFQGELMCHIYQLRVG